MASDDLPLASARELLSSEEHFADFEMVDFAKDVAPRTISTR
jgi:hypothetical protein